MSYKRTSYLDWNVCSDSHQENIKIVSSITMRIYLRLLIIFNRKIKMMRIYSKRERRRRYRMWRKQVKILFFLFTWKINSKMCGLKNKITS